MKKIRYRGVSVNKPDEMSMRKLKRIINELGGDYSYSIQSIVDHISKYYLLENENQNTIINDLPNDINLLKLKELLKFSDKYEISIQFWPDQIAVYIAKDGIDLIDFGGSFLVINNAISYLNRINSNN